MTRLTTNITFNYWKKTTCVYGATMSYVAVMDPSRLKEPTSSHLNVGDLEVNSFTLKQINSSTYDSNLNLLEIMILHNV